MAAATVARPIARPASPSRSSAQGKSRETVVAQSFQADHAVLAMQLLGRWQRASVGHLSLTTSCACGYGAAINLADFDDLILDFLRNRFAADAALTSFIQSSSTTPNSGTPSLRALLRAVATKSQTIPVEACTALLTAIDSSVTSIEEQHP